MCIRDSLHFRVGDQIQVPLTVPGLQVREAVPLLRKRPERLGERQELGGGEGQLPGLAPEERALDADEVTQVGELEALELVTEHVLLDVNLELAAPVPELDERRLSEAPDRHHPTGDRIRRPRDLELLRAVGGMLPGDVPGQVGGTEPVPEGVAAQLAPAPGLLQALAVELVLLCRFVLVAHAQGASPTPERPGWDSSRRGA